MGLFAAPVLAAWRAGNTDGYDDLTLLRRAAVPIAAYLLLTPTLHPWYVLLLLPFLLIYMMIIVNDRRIMGRYVNRRGANALGWTTIVVVIALTAALLVMTLLGIG